MVDSKEIQALGKISSEVDESQVRIIVSSQCIKAQAFLVDRLRKETERQKQICKLISGGNIKLEAEIKASERELTSLMKALDSIKLANVELKKEWLVAKESRAETFERVKNGEKKYEDLWLQCKDRYESIPYVQKWLQETKKTETLGETIALLNNEAQVLAEEIKTKTNIIIQEDRTNVIKLARYFIQDLPAVVKTINEKTMKIEELTGEIEECLKQQENLKTNLVEEIQIGQVKGINEDDIKMAIDDEWPNLCKYERNILMPNLKLTNTDLDCLSEKLDKIKKVNNNTATLSRVDSQPVMVVFSTTPAAKPTDKENSNKDVYSSYFNKISKSTHEVNNTENSETVKDFSKRKLINILEDIQLDKNEASKIVSKVNPLELHGVDIIRTEINKKMKKPLESEQIEEVDISNKSSQNILIPPTQFLDLTAENIATSQQHVVDVIVHMSMNGTQKINNGIKALQEKKVTFDCPISQEVNRVTEKYVEEIIDIETIDEDNKIENETINSQLDNSNVSDESFAKIRDMMLKKHNLDLSPQFSYAKNSLQTKMDEKIVTSKFFKQGDVQKLSNNMDPPLSLDILDQAENIKAGDSVNNGLNTQQATVFDNNCKQEHSSQIVTEDMTQTLNAELRIPKYDKPITGLLFNHGPQGIPDSLNVSISTTFDEGDTDFPHGIDTNLLLSPTADLPIPLSGDNTEVTSQEVPNFLTGLRKTGLSFFGRDPSSENKPQDAGSNFSFNFGGNAEDKKNRGGLFSMFR